MDFSVNGMLLEFSRYVLFMAISGLVFLVIERLKPIQQHISFTQEKRTELYLSMISHLIMRPVCYSLTLVLFLHSLNNVLPMHIFSDEIQPLPLVIQVLLATFIIDMKIYLRHRLMHRFFWHTHAVHHSAKDINWLTGERLHPLEIWIDYVFSIVILHVFGFEGDAIAIASLVVMAFNYFTHANVDFVWPGPLRFVLSSPNLHRWHHAKTEKDAYNKNFGVVFPFIDIVFGTYHFPKNALPSAYGINYSSKEKEMRSTLWGHLSYPFSWKA